jgi:cytochrome c553
MSFARKRLVVGAVCGAAMTTLAWAGPAVADGKLKDYGRHLSAECTSCHRTDGIDNGIPSITGWSAATFLATMEYYRTGVRTNPAMVSVAQSLDEHQLQALAEYFASLPKPPGRAGVKAPGGPLRSGVGTRN